MKSIKEVSSEIANTPRDEKEIGAYQLVPIEKVQILPSVIIENDVSSFFRACSRLNDKDLALNRIYTDTNRSLIALKKSNGEAYVRIQISMLIASTQDYLNIHSERKLPDHVIKDIANTIIDTYPNIYLSDIATALHRVKSGKMGGKILTISGAMICSWVDDIWEGILKEVIEARRLEHDATKKYIR